MICDQCQTVDSCKQCGCIYDRPPITVSVTNTSTLDKQISGDHYKDKGIQPIVYIHANNMGFCVGNVVKYVTRYKSKGGAADIKKAIHYLELLLELEYKDDPSAS